MLLRLSLVLGLLAMGLEGLGREPEQELQPPIPGLEEAVRPPPPPGAGLGRTPTTVQILFLKPDGSKVFWDVTTAGAFDSPGLTLPGRQNFPANAIYRVRLTDVSGHKGEEFFPTLEIGPIAGRAEKFLTHNAVPIQFTPDELDNASRGTFVTKVIYLADEELAKPAVGRVDSLVSIRLDAGVDPIIEADRRGTILAIVRLHDKERAERPAEAETVSKSESETVATPGDTDARVFRSRRGLLRRR